LKYEDKKEIIKKLRESELRRNVIIPLLKAAGYSDVHEFHGTIEKGKDILFREPNKLGESFIHAVMVSKEDISGVVGDSKSASRILEQAEMVFNESYKDKYTGKIVSVDRCWVITSGNITPQAIESISGKLEKYNLNRLIRFIDGDKVIELIDQHYPQFWERKEEYAFYWRYDPIEISTNKLDPPYDREVDNLGAAGNLKDSVYKIKKLVDWVLSEIDDDIRQKLTNLLRSNHPWDIVKIWEEFKDDYLTRDFYIALYWKEKLVQIDRESSYLIDDLNDYEEKFGIGKNDRYSNQGGG
jgi:hypothetical protein